MFRALEAGDVDQRQYRQIARFLKNEAPELTVHEALRVLEKPLPPVRAMGESSFDSSFGDRDEEFVEEWGGATAVAEADDLPIPDVASSSTRISSVQRLIWARGHLARVSRQGLTTGERQEVLRLLQLIEQDVQSLLKALEE